ncbi:uncharacterized protein TRIADDRAFT_59859 [Trichoplax adhaerens]|uniref:Retinoblastoma-like protein 1 n=1 Tax=Trichoplax adhaerens TaxID=10228 RepID=B3S6M6_TRIAD|nr:hypothetical protein TRIADDRAFT_59859 [Trichoplax adhaerens]EDV21648.1 hypothetical protein TRIADDRAFT_59859 [Trichoplax adhaerens]|eukprot:XP_002115796.1 hypothetical protein TRIADDRAFT_59859 [Trichoplax adhaerens]
MTFHGKNPPDDRPIRSEYDELCLSLNMDKDTAQTAWQRYQDIKLKFTLEGNHLHWLTCALFVAGKQSRLPTVGEGIQVGNCISLSRLIKAANLSLIEFFNKIDKWIDMACLDEDFRGQINVIERNFEVVSVIYKNKFEPIFQHLFQSNVNDSVPRRKLRHSKICTYQQVFSYCWSLYLLIKGKYPDIRTDLVNSYHLLLCCIDLIYANIVVANRRDLLNPQLESDALVESESNSSPVSVIEYLCKRYEGISIEVKAIKQHLLWLYLENLFDKNHLRGNKKTFCGLLDQGNFDYNNKFVSNSYDEFVLSSGDFDERIFLGSNAYLDIGTPAKLPKAAHTTAEARQNVTRNLQDRFQNSTMIPQTPLTGRNFLNQKEERTPVSSATLSVGRLQALLAKWTVSPSNKLLAIFGDCSNDLLDIIQSRINELKETFYDSYTKIDDERSKSPIDFAENRWNLGIKLYYKTLESIILAEKRRNKTSGELKILLEKDVFHRSLLACCLEITIFSYGSQKTFPWIVQVFGLSHYYFYKVIEIVIRTEHGLPREVVKHLNYIEESILDHLAWVSGSPLFTASDNGLIAIPSYEEVCIPSNEEGHSNKPAITNIVHPQMRRLNPALAGPIESKGFPVAERYSSPMKKSIEARSITDAKDTSKPKRTGSLGLFFRKFYYLASVRLKDLCRSLHLGEDLTSKIWTCFEYSVMHCHELIIDRHLDQLLMCAIYVICKVSRKNTKFLEIKDCYNRQPQAKKHLYRNVLVRKRKGKSDNKSVESSRNSSPVSPPIIISGSTTIYQEQNETAMRSSSTLSQTPTPSCSDVDVENGELEDVRGDLVQFYNEVYLDAMKEFVLRFLPENGNSQVSGRHSVFVSIFGCDSPPLSPKPKMLYSFQESPDTILKDINDAVKQSERTGDKSKAFTARGRAKRAILQNDEPDILPKRSRQSEVLTKRLSNLTSDKEKVKRSQGE